MIKTILALCLVGIVLAQPHTGDHHHCHADHDCDHLINCHGSHQICAPGGHCDCPDTTACDTDSSCTNHQCPAGHNPFCAANGHCHCHHH